jgi:hypothetical protein
MSLSFDKNFDKNFENFEMHSDRKTTVLAECICW